MAYPLMPEGEKLCGPVVIGGDNLPSPVEIGLTDPPNIGPPPLTYKECMIARCLFAKRMV